MEKQRESNVISIAAEHSGHSMPPYGGKGPWKTWLCVGKLLLWANTVSTQLPKKSLGQMLQCRAGDWGEKYIAKALFQVWQFNAGSVPSSPTECSLHYSGLRQEQLAEALSNTTFLVVFLYRIWGKGLEATRMLCVDSPAFENSGT